MGITCNNIYIYIHPCKYNKNILWTQGWNTWACQGRVEEPWQGPLRVSVGLVHQPCGTTTDFLRTIFVQLPTMTDQQHKSSMLATWKSSLTQNCFFLWRKLGNFFVAINIVNSPNFLSFKLPRFCHAWWPNASNASSALPWENPNIHRYTIHHGAKSWISWPRRPSICRQSPTHRPRSVQVQRSAAHIAASFPPMWNSHACPSGPNLRKGTRPKLTWSSPEMSRGCGYIVGPYTCEYTVTDIQKPELERSSLLLKCEVWLSKTEQNAST